jgi:hypothetical protein
VPGNKVELLLTELSVEMMCGSYMISKQTNARKILSILYTHSIRPPCFGHSCGHPQGSALQRTDTSKLYIHVTVHHNRFLFK